MNRKHAIPLVLLLNACSHVTTGPTDKRVAAELDLTVPQVQKIIEKKQLTNPGLLHLPEQMRDAIVPIYEPSYGGSDDGDWLPDRELSIGYVGEDASYAYPVRMLNFHELVTDTIDDVPLLVTY